LFTEILHEVLLSFLIQLLTRSLRLLNHAIIHNSQFTIHNS